MGVRFSILKYCDKYGVKNFDGESYRDIYQRLVDSVDFLHSYEELEEKAFILLNELEDLYDYRVLSVGMRFPLISTKGYSGFDLFYLYENIIREIGDYCYSFCSKFGIIDELDKEVFQYVLVRIYRDKYGIILKDDELAFLLSLIRKHFYDKKYLLLLESDIKRCLFNMGDKYFVHQDLSVEDNVKELYRVFGENYGFPEYRFGFGTDYDGNGNIVYDLSL